LLRRSTVVLPIPGTSSLRHLDENAGAVNVELPDEDFDQLGQSRSDVVPA
jgi:aryl-alcohol dehydrogenase-like predicted oxidoreductase